MTSITGGCLCGAVRYEARAEPLYMGHCYCGDCRRASGSGFIPFMAFAANALTIRGEVLIHSLTLADGRVADRNHCAACGGLVYGGIVGEVESHTIYAGSLDDPRLFHPTMAIFTRGAPAWALIPEGLAQFEGMPG